MRATIRKTRTRRGRSARPTLGLGLKRWLECAPAAMCLLAGPERRVALANAAFRELVTEECLIGRPLGLLLPDCEAALADAPALQALASGTPLRVPLEAAELGAVKLGEAFTWLVFPLAEYGESRHLLMIGATA